MNVELCGICYSKEPMIGITSSPKIKLLKCKTCGNIKDIGIRKIEDDLHVEYATTGEPEHRDL